MEEIDKHLQQLFEEWIDSAEKSKIDYNKYKPQNETNLIVSTW